MCPVTHLSCIVPLRALLPYFTVFNARLLYSVHGRTGRKKLGGRKEICPTFSDCARVVKNIFPEKLSKIVIDGGGEGVSTNNSY